MHGIESDPRLDSLVDEEKAQTDNAGSDHAAILHVLSSRYAKLGAIASCNKAVAPGSKWGSTGDHLHEGYSVPPG